MHPGILFALVSLAFAGFLDVSYKLFADRGESRGCFLSAMAVGWLVLQTAVLAGSEQHLTLNTVNWLFGLTAGLAITATLQLRRYSPANQQEPRGLAQELPRNSDPYYSSVLNR